MKTLHADTSGCTIQDGAFDAALYANPLLDPVRVLFHHDFNYYGLAAYSPAITITHPALAGASSNPFTGITINGQSAAASTALIYHGLGYVPKFFVSMGGAMLPQGVPVQNLGGGRIRFVTAWADTNYVRIWERYYSTDLTLPAFNITYAVAVFRDPIADPSYPMLEIDPGAGRINFGQGKFRVDQRPLRIAASGDTPFDIALGRTADVSNGGLRVVPPGDPAINYGAYAGSFAGSASLGLTI